MERLPEITEFFKHEFHYKKFDILKNLFCEIFDKFTSMEDSRRKFISIHSPIFKKIVEKYESEFKVTNEEFEAVFTRVKNCKDKNDVFFVFKIKKYDDENSEIFIDFGEKELSNVRIEMSESELFYINRHYEVSMYMRLYSDHLEIVLISTD